MFSTQDIGAFSTLSSGSIGSALSSLLLERCGDCSTHDEHMIVELAYHCHMEVLGQH